MPQPIDPATEINRAAAVERLQQLTSRSDLNAHARNAHALAQQQLDAETHVERPEAKSDEVERELKRRNPYLGRRKKRPLSEESPSEEARTFYSADEKPTVVEDEPPHKLDITI